jgi:hypothetical protein
MEFCIQTSEFPEIFVINSRLMFLKLLKTRIEFGLEWDDEEEEKSVDEGN